MPGRLYLRTPLRDIAAWLPFAVPDAPANTPRMNMQPGQPLVCLTSDGFQDMRWGIMPVGRVNARGRPVMETLINARSETVFSKSAFEGMGRAVVVVDGWYEWTGPAGKKTAWRIFGKQPLIFAAISDVWTAPGGLEVPQVATLTCEPNADVAPLHHRMGVLLRPKDVRLWLTGSSEHVAGLLKPWPAGLLTVEEASDVDWRGA
ncbi:MAG: SOS response-associated peptidase [Cognatishimia sp.]